jgi:hypothetical protein
MSISYHATFQYPNARGVNVAAPSQVRASYSFFILGRKEAK